MSVPFTSQAPTKDWRLPFQEACEEASIIMVKHYLRSEGLSVTLAEQEIRGLVALEETNGMGVDIGADQVLQISNQYYGLDGEIIRGNQVTIKSIKTSLAKNRPVIIPAAGRILDNPNYIGSGPPYHMIVVVGYNQNGFITHDPGTQFGANHEYSYDTFMNAIHDWNGSKSTVLSGQKAMVVLR